MREPDLAVLLAEGGRADGHRRRRLEGRLAAPPLAHERGGAEGVALLLHLLGPAAGQGHGLGRARGQGQRGRERVERVDLVSVVGERRVDREHAVLVEREGEGRGEAGTLVATGPGVRRRRRARRDAVQDRRPVAAVGAVAADAAVRRPAPRPLGQDGERDRVVEAALGDRVVGQRVPRVDVEVVAEAGAPVHDPWDVVVVGDDERGGGRVQGGVGGAGRHEGRLCRMSGRIGPVRRGRAGCRRRERRRGGPSGSRRRPASARAAWS